MDFPLLKAPWYIRYPIASCLLYVAWLCINKGLGFISIFFVIDALVVAYEISPSILLIAGSIWLWPSDFFDTPFSQMTFGILFQFAGSVVLFFIGIIWLTIAWGIWGLLRDYKA